jgi:hypothetical protein
MRKIRLDAAIATRASIKSCGNIVEYYNVALGFQPVGDPRRMGMLQWPTVHFDRNKINTISGREHQGFQTTTAN